MKSKINPLPNSYIERNKKIFEKKLNHLRFWIGRLGNDKDSFLKLKSAYISWSRQNRNIFMFMVDSFLLNITLTLYATRLISKLFRGDQNLWVVKRESKNEIDLYENSNKGKRFFKKLIFLLLTVNALFLTAYVAIPLQTLLKYVSRNK
jgi:hypothetical protein